jgi:outer membrane protein assembly factor BamB
MKFHPMDRTAQSAYAIRLTMLLALIFVAGHVAAQPAPSRFRTPATFIRPLGMPRAVAPAASAPIAQGDDSAEDAFPGGATLKTDAEQQRLLKRAQQCVVDGRLDLAVILWQRVLDEAGDTLMTKDGRTYRSLAEEVEGTLAQLDPSSLKAYRITADGEAQAVLSKATEERTEEALAEVVRRFFLSSYGDDAAFELGCLALDRYDFVGASRLFTRILERHPDPSMPRAEILLRLAVANSRVGDRESAKRALEVAATAPGARPNQAILELVEQHLEAASAVAHSGETKSWRMALGGAQRSGHMPGLPTESTSKTLTELWVQEYGAFASEQVTHNPWSGMSMPVGVSGRVSGRRNQAPPPSRTEIISQWRDRGWRPAGQLLFDEGRVYVKTADDLSAFSTGATSDRPVWQSAWINQYELDSMSQMLMLLAANAHAYANPTGKPRTAIEIMLFGDRVHQSMSISDGVIYSIEGKRISRDGPPSPSPSPRGFQWGVTPRRTRTNWLAAYDARSGEARWHRSASDEKEGAQNVGFLAAPVPFGGQTLLVPVTDGGTIFLQALKASDGSTLWKSYLCDEPAGGCSPWAQVQIAVDGQEAYVACGAGVVFAVDATSGGIRWAVRYRRDGQLNRQIGNAYGQQTPLLELNGWEDDVVIPYGRALVVMSSDSDRLFALDRRTGDLLWESPRSEADYCLGVNGRSLFVAGKNVVRRYDIPTGLMKAEVAINDSFGRGVLTSDAVYVPVKDSIVKLDLDKGKELGQVGVSLTADDPVGNLYSDGEKLWVTGGGRVYAMTNLEHRLELLQQQIDSGNYEAQMQRARLFARIGRVDEVFADLRSAHQLAQNKLSPDEAALKLFETLGELRLTTKQPIGVLRLLSVAFAERKATELGKETITRRSQLISSALHVLRQRQFPHSTETILEAAPLLAQPQLLHAAATTINATAIPAERLILLEAIGSESSEKQLLAIPALARIAPDSAKLSLAQLSRSSDDRVRLSAARALLNLGDRTMLEVLIDLLQSDDPTVRSRSHQTLRGATGATIAYVAGAKEEDRAKGVVAWRTWLLTQGASAKLRLPLPEKEPALGRLLIASHVHSLVIELDAERKERWRIRVANPWGVQGLPNGHRLVGAYSNHAVYEYDENGKEVWQKKGLPGPVYSVQRLENGNTLVALADVHQILEITPDGTATAQTLQGRPMHATRLENGNTLVALQQGNRVVEIDPEAKIVWEARNLNGPSSAVRLENGNTLVTQMHNGKLVEIDATGQNTVWSSSVPLVNPTAVQRLESGHTLVADNNGVHELDTDGKRVLSTHRQNNVAGLSSF